MSIKSINYQANQIASIEISDASDVQSLGDSYGYGSTARVTGQIGDEYIYTPQGWIKISSGGGSGGGVLIVHGTATENTGETTLDKTWAEIESADFAVISIVAPNGLRIFAYIGSVVHEDKSTTYGVAAFARVGGGTSGFVYFDFETDSPDGYPTAILD